MKEPQKVKTDSPGPEPCLARYVADSLADEPTLEAVTIDPLHEKITVATLGRTNVDELAARLTNRLHQAQSNEASHA